VLDQAQGQRLRRAAGPSQWWEIEIQLAVRRRVAHRSGSRLPEVQPGAAGRGGVGQAFVQPAQLLLHLRDFAVCIVQPRQQQAFFLVGAGQLLGQLVAVTVGGFARNFGGHQLRAQRFLRGCGGM